MDPRQLPIDNRLIGVCVFCGGHPDTRDHAPSKVFLDEPFPEDLAVVEACAECNRSFSIDEEYLACFLEAVLFRNSGPSQNEPNENKANTLSKSAPCSAT
jgi:hypothetical protein